MPRILIVAAAVLFTSTLASAQGTLTFSTIPRYTGATQVELDENEASITVENPGQMRQNERTHRDMTVRSVETTAYEVKAPLEDVYAFYFSKLGGTEEWNDQNSSVGGLKPGKPSPTLLAKTLHEFDSALERGDNTDIPGSVKRATLQRSRKPLSPGGWLSDALFRWSVREANQDITDLAVSITDEGLAEDWSTWTPRTRILITRVTYADEDE